MKKLFNKMLAIILLFSIITYNLSPLLVYATEAIREEKAQSTIIDDIKISPKGNIEIEAFFALPIRNNGTNNIVLTIYDENKANKGIIKFDDVKDYQDGLYMTQVKLGSGEEVSQTIRATITKRDSKGLVLTGDVESENIVYYSINLYSLATGKYTLELSGKNYVTYSVQIELNDYSQRVSLTNGKGMFEIGDVNADGKVDNADETAMLEAIKSGNLDYDLNLDKKTDIADLNYITSIINSESKSADITNTSTIISSENISLELDSGTKLAGDSNLANLFTEDSTVSLAPASNEKISEDNPVELSLDLSKDEANTVEMSEVRIGVGTDNVPKKMELLVETETGDILRYTVDDTAQGTSEIHTFTDDPGSGTIKVDLGKQVAVKKVTIRITETSTNTLADIAKVEFLNNVKVELEEPEGFYIPDNVHIDDTVSEQLTVTFDNVPNVTGYEIKIVDPSNKEKIFQTTYNTFTIEDLKNYTTYRIYLQSVNGEWLSGWSEAHEGTPKATRKPPKVDMVNATPTISGIDFTWKPMDDTRSYKLYYKKEGTAHYTLVDNLIEPKYSLRGLEASTTYEAYIIGVNELGESSSYTIVKATTLEAGAPVVQKYNLINDTIEGNKTSHIENVYYTAGKMTGDNKFSIVDDNFNTYWQVNDWQISASVGYNSGTPVIELDQVYKMDEFILTVPDNYVGTLKSGGPNSNDVKVHYWAEDYPSYDSKGRQEVRGTLIRKQDDSKRTYYLLKLEEPISAKAVAFGLTAANNLKDIRVDEVKFYKYDPLVDEVAKLFVDDLRVELADGVNEETIANLRKKADIKDHDEYNPYRESVLADLKYAEDLLHDKAVNDVITLNPNISNSYNSHVKFAMTISDYQPLGVVARPKEKLNVYIGTKGNVNVQLVFTQYHAEAGTWNTVVSNLTKGLNIIEVPKIGSANTERGGSVYIRYTSKPDPNNLIKVRVSGGTKIPMVDTTLLTTDDAKKAAIKKYIEDLTTYNASLTEKYNKDNESFDPRSSVLGSTEIVTKYGLLSVSSKAVEDAINSNLTTIEDKTNRLFESMEAFDEMMELFYRQKGFSETTSVSTDLMPKARINVRYMQMFDGAFMYAGGYHVGIEYGSIAGLIQAHRNSENATGYFGWGISHEVGHQINLSDTVFAEVTNNIYSLLAQTSNDKDLSRLENQGYDKIYEKVTSNTTGRAQNVFVQLGMYWQLHLAYDNNRTFDDTESVYAKINQIARTYKNPNNYTRDELTILYACMATGKDLTEFFAKWGLKASDKLKAEIASLTFGEEGTPITKEERPIYYLNDKARRYILGGGQGITSESNILTAKLGNVDGENKRVTISFSVSSHQEDILGYEILRNGTPIGFVEQGTDTFVDNVGSENNRAYTYSVVAYDYLLNHTNTVTLEEVKVSHDGSVKKDNFTITSNFLALGESYDVEDENFDYKDLQVNNLIDGNPETGFIGVKKISSLSYTGDKTQLATDKNNPYVIINLNNPMSICGIKYRAYKDMNGNLEEHTITNYKIYVSTDGEKWTEVRTGTFDISAENQETTVYFMGQGKDSESQLWTYKDVAYVKIEAVGNKGISGAEIDVIAPPGDNIEFSDNAIGKLETDYCYLTDGCPEDDRDEDGNVKGIIKAGDVVIQGKYTGNPSFNNILIGNPFDEKKVYNGYFLIFAELNSDKSVYDVAEGTWLYVLSREEYEKMITDDRSIRAYLYRVNDALTLDGQRLTSTSKVLNDLPDYDSLSNLTIESKQK